MLVKLLGCIIIILCSAKIGFEEAAKYSTRVKEIRSFKRLLPHLKEKSDFAGRQCLRH